MRRVAGLLLLLGITTSCHLDVVDLAGLCLSPEGCTTSGGNGITYVPEQVLIRSGGVLVPDTVTLTVRPNLTRQPAVD